MPRILYGVSAIGFGHASRTVAVVRELLGAGAEVEVYSGGDAAVLLSLCGLSPRDVVADPTPAVSDGEMKRAAFWYLRSWLAHRRNLRKTSVLFDEYRPDIVVCDEEFSGVGVAARGGRRTVFISDELELGFARGRVARVIEARVERWYRHLQETVDILVIPDTGTDVGNRRYVGPVVRRVTEPPAAVRSRYGLPPTGTMALVSLSGSSAGSFIKERALRALGESHPIGSFTVVTGGKKPGAKADGVYDLGVVGDNQNLVAAADLVISTAGKSTQDEAASSGTPFIGLPIKHHAEQERNAASTGYSAADLDRLPELIGERMGKRSAPREFLGAEATAKLILSAC